MPVRTPIDEIIKHISSFQYKTLLSDFSNINDKTKIPFICHVHGEFFITLKALKQGVGCRKCSAKKRALNSASKLENLLVLLNEKYGNRISYISGYKTKGTKCTFECKEHGLFETTFEVILKGKKDGGCPKCAIKLRGKPITPIEEIKKIVNTDTYEVISKNYSSHDQKIEVFCFRHNVSNFLTLDKIKKGRRCKYCSYENIGRDKTLSKEEVTKRLKKTPYRLGSDYIKVSKKATFVCEVHGEFKAMLGDIEGGHRCPSCANKKSQPTTDIVSIIDSLNLKPIREDRSIIKNEKTGRFLELDIYVPEKKLAIEYCGLHWHTEGRRNRHDHLNKKLLCQEKQIQLLTIFEDEWLERRPQVENIIKAKLGALPKIYGRKTQLVELTKEEAKKFLDANHLQGSCVFLYAAGLKYDGKIVGCATLSKHHRNGHNIAVLSRVCFGEYAILGGSSKLLKIIEAKAKDLGFKSIISWSDNRWSNGRLYKELGMIPEELPPDYSYVFKNKRFSKQSCKKSNLKKKGAIGNTELEMAKSLGYKRIWDCGKIRWTKHLE